MTAYLADHLWQSTAFAAIAGFLTLGLRKNHARVRHAIWFAASVKFFVPFALLVTLGNQIHWRQAEFFSGGAVMRLDRTAYEQGARSATREIKTSSNSLPQILFGVWLAGFAVGVAAWIRQWRRVRGTMRTATPATFDLPIPVKMTKEQIEPGVFGVFRPVLLLPAGIETRLSPAELAAIVAHELCHVRRRDNLTAAIHMAVETVFWFCPPVWLIRERLVAEREQACDEEVLRRAGNPEAYAAGILNVCKLYLAAPACVAGVTGSDLTRRIEAIMTHHAPRDLNRVRKFVLASLAIAAVAAPFAAGVWTAPPARAQSKAEKPLAFEVASVKPADAKSDSRRVNWQVLPGGRLVGANVPLKWLIANAFEVSFQSKRLTGGPDWLGERYDIEATAEKGAIPPSMSTKERNKKISAMLRTLLADRFHLKMRTDSIEMPVYELVVGKGGPKLVPATIDVKTCEEEVNECNLFNGGMGRGLHAKAATVQAMASFIENWTDRLVQDKTGITGYYSFESSGWQPFVPRQLLPGETINPAEGDINDPERPTIFMVLEKFGLRLSPQKSKVDTYVIEHVERPTTN